MKKILLLLIVLLILSGCSEQKNQVCFKKQCFNVEIADTEEEQLQGLMFRNSLTQDEGMLFILEKEDPLIYILDEKGNPISAGYDRIESISNSYIITSNQCTRNRALLISCF